MLCLANVGQRDNGAASKTVGGPLFVLTEDRAIADYIAVQQYEYPGKKAHHRAERLELVVLL